MVSKQGVKSPEEAEKRLNCKKYIVIKNHVREFTSEKHQGLEINNDKCASGLSEKREQSSTVNHSASYPEVNLGILNTLREDMEEIQAVFNQCKATLEKFESKYGEFLHSIHGVKEVIRKRKRDDEKECYCKLNKKIVFDDEGSQVVQNTITDSHICDKRIQKYRQPYKVPNRRVSIEEETYSNNLPDNLKELSDMLKNLDISATLRRKILKKIKSIRFEYLNTMKLDKACLIQAIKSNADEVFQFNGSNVSSLQGYLTSK